MPKRCRTAALLLIVGCALASCQKEEPHNPVDPTPEIYVTDSVHYEAQKMTAYNFVYMSTDPHGKRVPHSATITMSDDVTRHNPARGLILYNHFTIYRADQCPSRGELSIQTLMLPSGMIAISPDYYGFGVTEKEHQAYSISRVNAQSSVDALIAGKKLLKEMGFSWEEKLFNMGYSQGGQTTMGVVRLVDEKYPDIHIDYSFAGAGPYDIHETYRQFINATIAGMPSTVISVLLSYNEYFNLGILREEVFREPVLSNINEWILSKRYTREEIDAKVGSLAFAEYVTPTMTDTTTRTAQRYLAAMDQDNLCQGWLPREDENILLFHNTQDITVPVENTSNLHHFLLANGAQHVVLDTANYGSTDLVPAHEAGAIFFMIRCVNIMSEILGIEPWNIF